MRPTALLRHIIQLEMPEAELQGAWKQWVRETSDEMDLWFGGYAEFLRIM
ncbi:hypothetical protein EFBL_1501 [Effusibacillus lacus]|uniref:Uncharacterized protein n=1 Tax=Effusibacillus lacus TaxID=1348429 RepID=A0A292YL28_9BACL|nr:hypothetical protein EDD64_12750 [Effusibacillus lacus]GAX89876.1 hypothetical protein EFBL_1501 [Effusibacillus lacus]